MVDGINWDNIDLNKINPFTGLKVSDGDIEIVDIDKDGDLTQAEWTAASAHYVSTADNDGIAKVGIGSDYLEELSRTEGVKEFVNGITEFSEQLDLIADVYLEKYCSTNYGISDEEKTIVKNLINTTKTDLLNKYKSSVNAANGKFDMKPIAALFEINIEKTITTRKETERLNNEKINSFVDNKDFSYLDLLDLTMAANENGNISQVEFNKMKAAAVKYLMGVLLSDELDETLVATLDKNYNASGSYYKKAKDLINSIKNETDPQKVKKALEEAEQLLDSFVKKCGGDKLASAVNEVKQTKAEESAYEILNKYIDEYVESMSTADMTEEQKAELKKFINTCADKYITKLVEDGKIDSITTSTLINNFATYVAAQEAALAEISISVMQQSSKIIDNYDKLITISKKANENGNISEEEKEEIVEAAAEMIMSQILSGLTDVTFLSKLNPSYQSSKEWREVQSILNKFNTSVDPDELKDLQDKAKEQIKALLNKYSGDQLVSAVNFIKPVEVSEKIKSNALYNSDIYADYEAGTVRTTSYGKQNDDSLEAIQELAKQDLENYAAALKKQLQKELGDAYNESEVQRYINDAITDTIAIFTGNVRRECKNGYSVSSDEQAFLFKRKGSTHKGRYAYNVKALIDTFTQCFNETSKAKSPTKLDPSLATYDFENAIYRTEGLGNDYYRNKSETVKGSSRDDEKAYAELIERATSELKKLGEQLKISLKEEGLDIPEWKVDEWIQECIKDTIKDMKDGFQVCQPNGNVSGGLNVVTNANSIASLGYAAKAAYYGAKATTWSNTAAFLAKNGSNCAQYATELQSAAFHTAETASNTSSALSFAKVTPIVDTALFAVTTTLDITSGNFNAVYTGIDAALTAACWIPGIQIYAGAAKVVLGALRQWTNIFGATWGQHNANAGFYFERKSNSHSGNFGYDTQTLVNLFMNKFDTKLNEWKKEEKDEKAKAGQVPESPM